MDDTAWPFLVSTWLPEDPDLTPIYGSAKWVETARCKTEYRYKKVAQGLVIQGDLVKVSELQGDQFVPIAWYPDKETIERETRK